MPVPNMRDASLKLALVLPSGANTVVSATGFDIGPTSGQGNYAPAIDSDVLLESPALTVTELPNAATVTYDLISSASSNMGTPTVLQAAFLVVTGAGGAGAAATSKRFTPPSNLSQQYLGYRATGVAATLAATKSAALSIVV